MLLSPFWRFSEGTHLLVADFIGHLGRAVDLVISPVLAVFGGRWIYYFQPFWPFPEGGRFVTFAHLDGFRKGRTYHLRSFWPFLQGSKFIILAKFGHFRRAVDAFFSAILAVIAAAEKNIIIGYFRSAVDTFWPSVEGRRFINFGHFGHFLRVVALFFWPSSEGGRFTIFRHLGRFRRASDGVFLAIVGHFEKLLDLSFPDILEGFPRR